MQEVPLPARRFPLLAATRWMAPTALSIAVLMALFAGGRAPRIGYSVLAVIVGGLWLLARTRRPVLLVDDDGYRVEVGGQVKLRVRFEEVTRARAVPAEQAMYLDCGDPGRNLLLPTRRGFGFRFAEQGALYVLLAKRLGDRLEIADKLEETP
jgi:hypothetical protein